MNSLLEAALTTLIPSLITGIVTAKLTVRYSLKQFYSQKWLEKKSQAYSEVIGHLSTLETYFQERFDDAVGLQSMNEKNHETWDTPVENARVAVAKASSSGGYTISQVASKALTDLVRGMKEVDYTEFDQTSCFDSSLHLTRKCIETIKAEAEKDLKNPLKV